MASEEKTSAADIPLKSHQEVTTAASIPLKSHEEVVPWTMAREEIQLEGCAADFPVKSNREVENQIVGCAADFPDPIVAADFPVQIHGCAADFPVKSNRELESCRTSSTDQQIIDRSNEVSLDIKEIATSLRDHLETKKVFSRACCIYRVPA